VLKRVMYEFVVETKMIFRLFSLLLKHTLRSTACFVWVWNLANHTVFQNRTKGSVPACNSRMETHTKWGAP
jgi:hypothetical protein